MSFAFINNLTFYLRMPYFLRFYFWNKRVTLYRKSLCVSITGLKPIIPFWTIQNWMVPKLCSKIKITSVNREKLTLSKIRISEKHVILTIPDKYIGFINLSVIDIEMYKILDDRELSNFALFFKDFIYLEKIFSLSENIFFTPVFFFFFQNSF